MNIYNKILNFEGRVILRIVESVIKISQRGLGLFDVVVIYF